MKRFLKTLSFLIIGLFALVSGVNSALDRLSGHTSKSSLVVYDDKGTTVVAYQGNLDECKMLVAKSGMLSQPFIHFLHRT